MYFFLKTKQGCLLENIPLHITMNHFILNILNKNIQIELIKIKKHKIIFYY